MGREKGAAINFLTFDVGNYKKGTIFRQRPVFSSVIVDVCVPNGAFAGCLLDSTDSVLLSL